MLLLVALLFLRALVELYNAAVQLINKCNFLVYTKADIIVSCLALKGLFSDFPYLVVVSFLASSHSSRPALQQSSPFFGFNFVL